MTVYIVNDQHIECDAPAPEAFREPLARLAESGDPVAVWCGETKQRVRMSATSLSVMGRLEVQGGFCRVLKDNGTYTYFILENVRCLTIREAKDGSKAQIRITFEAAQ